MAFGDTYPVRWAGRQAVVALPEHIDVSNAGPLREELLSMINRSAAALIRRVLPVAMARRRGPAHPAGPVRSARLGHQSQPRGRRAVMRWSTGEVTVERLLTAGHIERVQGVQADGASWLNRSRRGLVIRPPTSGASAEWPTA